MAKRCGSPAFITTSSAAGRRHERQAMSFTVLRRALFQVHMWIGLVLGILLAALGLSGSLLVYDDEFANFLAPRPHATAQGTMLPLDAIVAAAGAAVSGRGQVQ